MNLLNLPVEILNLIFQQLDIISLFNLYRSCGQLRHLIASFGVKVCNLSMSTMATVDTLKSPFFKDISRNIQELNMCGITNLNRKILISSITKLQFLKTLNVSYTNITILNFIEIYKVCPSIKNITINFIFSNNYQKKIPMRTLIQCQEVFRNLESVNFIGNTCNLLDSQLPFFILSKAKLKVLQYTITNCVLAAYENEEFEESLHFDEFRLNFLSGLYPKEYQYFFFEMSLFTMLNIQDYEVIIIIYKVDGSKSIIYATPIFKNIFEKLFDLSAECLVDLHVVDLHVSLMGNGCVMLWSKRPTELNEVFYEKILQRLRPLLTFSFTSSTNTAVPLSYDWYCTIPTQESDPDSSVNSVSELSYKRQRNDQQNYILNYDKQFQNKSHLQLSLYFNGEMTSAVTLSTNSDYLKKLTYLNLCGDVQYSSDFFNILFRSCNQLNTLNIEVSSNCSCFASISRSIPLSRTLKNIRLVDEKIDFELMFSSMSQCKTLENVNICDMSLNTFNFSDPFIMFKNCNNLYCLYVYGPIPESIRSKNLKLMKIAKAKSKKPYLNVELFNKCEFYNDPYVAVF